MEDLFYKNFNIKKLSLSMDLKEQVVLVTGASRGLGAAIAKAFRKTGAKVVVNYFMNKEKAEEVVEQIGNARALAIQADVRNLEEVNALFVKARNYFKKPITTIVNNALIDFTFNGELRNKLDSIKWNEFQTQFEGSVKAAFHTLQAGRADMVGQNFGRIINIGTNLVQNPVPITIIILVKLLYLVLLDPWLKS
nr:SDR family NAD(P)-dependent oxidoreductase [Roseburia sp. 1XD42-34]